MWPPRPVADRARADFPIQPFHQGSASRMNPLSRRTLSPLPNRFPCPQFSHHSTAKPARGARPRADCREW